jgi:hypothetical protein
MHITADHAFHIGSQHLRGGLPCQDFALSGFHPDSVYAVVSDGCSTGGMTDVGSRVVALNTAKALDGPEVTGSIDFDVECFQADVKCADALGLNHTDLLATCVYIKAVTTRPGVQVRMLGDGVVAARTVTGSLWMARLLWAKNMPAYRAYHADGFESFHSQQDFDAVTIASHRRAGDERSDWFSEVRLPSAIRGHEWFFNGEDVDSLTQVAIFSDGVEQVDGMDWRDAVAELMAFKSTEGDFVKRRMNRFLKDCLKYGKGPIDDISMACIHIDHEAA